MKFTRCIAATTLAMIVAAGSAGAQIIQNCTGSSSAITTGCVVTNTVSSATPFVARLILSSATSTLTAPTAADFNTAGGVNTGSAMTLEVRSNSAYSINAAAGAANFSGGSGNKLSSSLTYTTDAFATTKVLAGAGSTLGLGATATQTTLYTIGYNTKYDWTIDTPGTYTLAVNYTLTAP